MEIRKHRGFILNKIHYGDADLILKIINDEGKKQTLFAKAAKKSLKRFSGGLEYFNLLTLEYAAAKNGSMGKLLTTNLERAYSPITHDLHRFALASVTIELIDHFLKEDDSDIHIFKHLQLLCERLENASHPYSVYCKSLLDLMRIFGYALDYNPTVHNLVMNENWHRLFALLEDHILFHGQKELKSMSFAKKLISNSLSY